MLDVLLITLELILLSRDLLVDRVQAGINLLGDGQRAAREEDLVGHELVIGVVGALDLDGQAGNQGCDAEVFAIETKEATLFGCLGGVRQKDGEAGGVGRSDRHGWAGSADDEAFDGRFLGTRCKAERREHRQRHCQATCSCEPLLNLHCITPFLSLEITGLAASERVWIATVFPATKAHSVGCGRICTFGCTKGNRWVGWTILSFYGLKYKDLRAACDGGDGAGTPKRGGSGGAGRGLIA